ncbi:IucA/IucC family protein [Amycolatopsis palatopharyngis]|uniref:IucA/IucC family protein n=1 Tax=Amycolatopsis palatopharyngis TaxID=187982 RepID=UPI0013BE8FC2|nr:IucA/IucC family protein [Amycolatopsis palatopharyngis]
MSTVEQDYTETAWRVARERLLNAFLRETKCQVPAEGELRIPLAAAQCTLIVRVRYRSLTGGHLFDDTVLFGADNGETVPAGNAAFLDALLREIADRSGLADAEARRAELAGQVRGSVAHTARYLAEAPNRGFPGPDAKALTRYAEQRVLTGHPFHPTPKSAEGFDENDLAHFAPELGASFVPHQLAVAEELLLQRRITDTDWTPAEVREHVPAGFVPLPAHPWQVRHLLAQPRVRTLVEEGGLVPLGPLGPRVYPTSSVRTVCDPGFPSSWKLPLHVRITNFVRTNPVEHLRRATDASMLIGRLLPGWSCAGFEVLLESGFRTIDPEVAGGDLSAEFGVLYRDNPFHANGQSPRVLAALLEEGPGGEPPELVRWVWEAGDTLEWLRHYLRISLLPLLGVFAADGVSFEAHVQNSLLCMEDGWPVRFWVRDLEGVSVSRDRIPARAGEYAPAPDSPVCYDDAEAWSRLRYHAVTNQLGHVLRVLGRHTGTGEKRLWRVVREEVAACEPAGSCGRDLLTARSLPAKANLLSRFSGRGERPLYVDVPNPLREE